MWVGDGVHLPGTREMKIGSFPFLCLEKFTYLKSYFLLAGTAALSCSGRHAARSSEAAGVGVAAAAEGARHLMRSSTVRNIVSGFRFFKLQRQRRG